MPPTFTPILLPVPHLQQSNDGDCLPTCAYMVLAYLGKRTRLWRLRWLMRVKSFGTPFFHIRNLQQLGITVELKTQGSLPLLHQNLLQNHPCIVSIQTENLPYWNRNALHAVVVVGIDHEAIYLNDPELPEAPVAVSHGDFELAWLAQDERFAILLP